MGGEEGSWEVIGFDQFILCHSPGLSMYIHCTKQFPPLHILNEELASGGRDMGMSGGCLWKPFKLGLEDYIEIRDEMLTDPELNLSYDKSLEDRPKLSKWCRSVVSKYRKQT